MNSEDVIMRVNHGIETKINLEKTVTQWEFIEMYIFYSSNITVFLNFDVFHKSSKIMKKEHNFGITKMKHEKIVEI